VNVAGVLNLVLSIGGLIIAAAIAGVWLIVRPASRAARASLATVLLAYAVTSTYPVPHAIAQSLRANFKPLERSAVPAGRTAVVLLGSGSFTQYDWANNRASVLDAYGLARAVEAARVFHLINPAWVICSGGRVSPDSPDAPLSGTMEDELVRLGVPAARIIPRDGAGDTHDEAVMTAGVLPSLHVDHVVVVTSGYHMRRAIGVFRAAGLAPIPAPARDEVPRPMPWAVRFLPGPRGMREARIVAHELLGLVYYKVRGWR
jgi:uncharacterized SAM-binding protein YcdF (DUF218 family)